MYITSRIQILITLSLAASLERKTLFSARNLPIISFLVAICVKLVEYAMK